MKSALVTSALVLASWLGSSDVAFAQVSTPCVFKVPDAIGGATIAMTKTARLYAKFCGGTASYTSDVYLTFPSPTFIGTGNVTPVDSVIDLGVLPRDSELIFALYVRNTGYTFFSGDARRNPDGLAHASIATLTNGQYLVGFEDIFGGGDHDYDDVVIIIATVPIAIEVSIDIRPGVYPNVVNMGSATAVPVAIFGNPTFDATQVDPDTISLAAASVKLLGKSDRSSCRVDDVNRDGLADLVCLVTTGDLVAEAGDTIAVLEAQTFAGEAITGRDWVRVNTSGRYRSK